MQLREAIAGLFHLLKNNEVEKAATLYSRLQDAVGYELVQQAPRDPGLRQRLAKMFFLAKDYEKAGIIFEQLGAFEKAGILYEKADQYGLAGEMYAKAEKWDKAAAMLEKGGNYAQAAELYVRIGELSRAAENFEKAVNHFLAGKMYFELHKEEKALELLQRIGKDDPNYLAAQGIICQILRRSGHRHLAIRRLTKLLEEYRLSEETLDLALALGEYLAEEGEFAKAKEWLTALLEIRFPYKHAAELLKLVEEGKAPHPPREEPPPEELEEIPIVEPGASASPEEPAMVPLAEEFAALKETSLLEELNLRELRLLWSHAEPLMVPPGGILIEQDQPGPGLILLAEGKVEVQKLAPSGEKQILATLEKGAHLGEMSLLDDTPTSARVVALTPVRAYRIPRHAFRTIIEQEDRMAAKIYRAFARTLMDRLRQTNERFLEMKNRERSLADYLGLSS